MDNKPTAYLPARAAIVALLCEIRPHMYYASTDPEIDEDTEPNLTIGWSPAESAEPDAVSWSYQTGSNSYTGGAYGHPVWAVGYLYTDTDDAQVDDIADNLLEQMGEQASFDYDVRDNPADDTETAYAIRAVNGDGYWSTDYGWGSFEESDRYSALDRVTLNLPIGGEWVADADIDPTDDSEYCP